MATFCISSGETLARREAFSAPIKVPAPLKRSNTIIFNLLSKYENIFNLLSKYD